MKKVFSIEEIKKIESFEFKKRGNSFSLMVDAGINCAKKIMRIIKKQPIIVICGPGNNGGDGFILSEYLKNNNYEVDVFCTKQKYYKGDALKAYKQLKIKTKNILDLKIKKNSLIVDCLFGIGISRNISLPLKKIILQVNRSRKKIISIDIPSGVNGNNGKIYGCAIKANVTLALHGMKKGHIFYPGKNYCGKTIIVDIDISKKFNKNV